MILCHQQVRDQLQIVAAERNNALASDMNSISIVQEQLRSVDHLKDIKLFSNVPGYDFDSTLEKVEKSPQTERVIPAEISRQDLNDDPIKQ